MARKNLKLNNEQLFTVDKKQVSTFNSQDVLAINTNKMPTKPSLITPVFVRTWTAAELTAAGYSRYTSGIMGSDNGPWPGDCQAFIEFNPGNSQNYSDYQYGYNLYKLGTGAISTAENTGQLWAPFYDSSTNKVYKFGYLVNKGDYILKRFDSNGIRANANSPTCPSYNPSPVFGDNGYLYGIIGNILLIPRPNTINALVYTSKPYGADDDGGGHIFGSSDFSFTIENGHHDSPQGGYPLSPVGERDMDDGYSSYIAFALDSGSGNYTVFPTIQSNDFSNSLTLDAIKLGLTTSFLAPDNFRIHTWSNTSWGCLEFQQPAWTRNDATDYIEDNEEKVLFCLDWNIQTYTSSDNSTWTNTTSTDFPNGITVNRVNPDSVWWQIKNGSTETSFPGNSDTVYRKLVISAVQSSTPWTQMVNIGSSSSVTVYFGKDSGIANYNTPCLLEGTKIYLWNGTTKNIEDITYNDLLLSFDHFTGKLIPQFPYYIKQEEQTDRYFRVTLDNDTVLNVVDEHCFYDSTNHIFIDFTNTNIRDLVKSNTTLLKLNNDKSFSDVGLKTVEFIQELTTPKRLYSLFTTGTQTYFANEVLNGNKFLNVFGQTDEQHKLNRALLDYIRANNLETSYEDYTAKFGYMRPGTFYGEYAGELYGGMDAGLGLGPYPSKEAADADIAYGLAPGGFWTLATPQPQIEGKDAYYTGFYNLETGEVRVRLDKIGTVLPLHDGKWYCPGDAKTYQNRFRVKMNTIIYKIEE